MVLHKIICSQPWHRKLETGEKPVEGRKGTPTFAGIVASDTIIFIDETGHEFRATVTGITEYKGHADNLRAFLETEILARALPGTRTIEEGMKVYYQWSTPDEIARHGFLGIQVRVP